MNFANSELRMPRTGRDANGTRYVGNVLTGKMSVEQVRWREAVEETHRRGDASRYGGVEEYDAVLRAHCRLDREG